MPPPAIDPIHGSHERVGALWLARAEKVLSELPSLAQIHQQDFGLAVREAWPVDLLDRLQCAFGQLAYIIGGVGRYARCCVCGFHDTWTLSPRSFGHSFHVHLDT